MEALYQDKADLTINFFESRKYHGLWRVCRDAGSLELTECSLEAKSTALYNSCGDTPLALAPETGVGQPGTSIRQKLQVSVPCGCEKRRAGRQGDQEVTSRNTCSAHIAHAGALLTSLAWTLRLLTPGPFLPRQTGGRRRHPTLERGPVLGTQPMALTHSSNHSNMRSSCLHGQRKKVEIMVLPVFSPLPACPGFFLCFWVFGRLKGTWISLVSCPGLLVFTPVACGCEG